MDHDVVSQQQSEDEIDRSDHPRARARRAPPLDQEAADDLDRGHETLKQLAVRNTVEEPDMAPEIGVPPREPDQAEGHGA